MAKEEGLAEKLEYLKAMFYHSGTEYAVESLYQLVLRGYQEILREVLHPDTTKLSGDIAQAVFYNLAIAESKAARFREQNPCSPNLSEQALAAKTLLCDPPYRQAIANAKREIEAGNYNHFHQLLDSNSELPQYLAKAGMCRLRDADSQSRKELSINPH